MLRNLVFCYLLLWIRSHFRNSNPTSNFSSNVWSCVTLYNAQLWFFSKESNLIRCWLYSYFIIFHTFLVTFLSFMDTTAALDRRTDFHNPWKLLKELLGLRRTYIILLSQSRNLQRYISFVVVLKCVLNPNILTSTFSDKST